MNTETTNFRIAALADIHVAVDSAGKYAKLFNEISDKADVLVLCGDLTNRGLIEEAEVLAKEISNCRVPVVTVLGNHDYHNDKQNDIAHILMSAGAHPLESAPFRINDVGFAGVKGFSGGFGPQLLDSFGETINKLYVQEAINETEMLESQLKELDTPYKVVLLHYSPIPETLKGENETIFPFLGTSRLMGPIDTFGVDVVFHGHAHHGTHEGMTAKGIPVFNVAFPLMQKHNANQPYKILTIKITSKKKTQKKK